MTLAALSLLTGAAVLLADVDREKWAAVWRDEVEP